MKHIIAIIMMAVGGGMAAHHLNTKTFYGLVMLIIGAILKNEE